MPSQRLTIEKSANYSFYTDLLWCCVPLVALSCYYYGLRPALLMAAAQLTAYVCDCVAAPLHGGNYRSHEPSSAYFAAMVVLMLPASASYAIVVAAVVIAVVVKEAFGGEGHYPFHPSAVALMTVGISWPNTVFRYPAQGVTLPLFGSMESIALSAGVNATLRSGGLPSASTINLLIGNVAAPMGTNLILVLLACAAFLVLRKRLHLSVLVPYLAACVLIPWLWPQLNELPAFSLPWDFVRQRVYLEKYVLLSGTTLFGGILLSCEPVTAPDRTASRVIYGLMLGIMTTVFRFYGSVEVGFCFALILVQAIPEWLDRLSRRAERMRFMRKEAERLAKQQKKPRG